MRKWILTLFLAAVAAAAWALPSLQDVESEVKAGRYAQAETMMREVVAAKPGSARAHYIYAEILAHQGKLAPAAEEAQKARLIDPDVKFTDPEKFRSFEASLTQAQRPVARSAQDARRPQAQAPAAPAPASSGIPGWVWIAGLAVVAFLLWRGFTRSRNAAVGGAMAAPGAGFGAPGQPGAPGAYPPGAVPPGYAPQRGSMLGTGLAAAGGVAAGMLASEMLHRHSERNAADDGGGAAAQPGFFDSPDDGRSALADRPIDFGSGGDWDAGGGDLGGGGGDGWD
jgi:hypothetical protein